MFKKYIWTWILLALALVMVVYLMWGNLFAGKEKLPEIREIQSFSMENVDGNTVSLEDTQGKVRLFYFYFTSCPDVCPITTFTLSQVQDLLKEDDTFGNDASFVSISFDPEVDTKEKIKEFADRFHADYNGWYFLRGDMEETKKFARESFQILIEGETIDDFAHMNLIGLVDRNNQLRKIYSAGATNDVDPAVIAEDIRNLMKE
ncbi:SCO family protein [Paenibacillus sp. ACRSA]|uniref:SCO family protein n=1 Tax=Paenibacillus sp. ACRSA TaxID=2918211 RepID=UPI001EF4488A|nr:SCO family protein [Paenibacillus sp. ACRSA]MCG7379997.1 SCO family protein [Paenibacillus sp. ACRSA]